LLTPWLEATLTLPEMVAVEAWGLEAPARANPGAAQMYAESNKAPQKIHRANFALLCCFFNNTLPNLALAILR
jgi:hypothetical protein